MRHPTYHVLLLVSKMNAMARHKFYKKLHVPDVLSHNKANDILLDREYCADYDGMCWPCVNITHG